MASKAITVALLLAAFSAVSGLRPLDAGHTLTGRRLLDINVGTTNTSFSLTAFNAANAVGGNCYLQGYPGSRADSTLSGPLTVSTLAGNSLTIGFTRTSDTYFANYNYSGATNSTSLTQNSSYGLVSVTFKPASPGEYVNVFSGLVSGSNPITQPACLVNITIFSVAPSPPPTPPPTPAPGNACNGVIPCYCQNGYCFNNGATLTNTCAPPGGQSCSPVSINPSTIGIQYATYSSPVNVCKCTATAG